MKLSMFKYPAVIATFLALGFALPAAAQNTYVELDGGSDITVSGVVTEVDGNNFKMQTETAIFLIDMDDIDIDGDINDFIEVGMTVTVEGEMEDVTSAYRIIEAKDVRIFGSGTNASRNVVIVEDDNELD